jgi:hypothetical protein
MRMDPVILLAEELRVVEEALRVATCERRHDIAHCLLLQVRLLRNCLADSAPTSALGAGELLRLAVEYLPRRQALYSGHMLEIAARWTEGGRSLDDMIWLRAIADALETGAGGEHGPRAARLVRSALAGASRPVLIHRSVLSPEVLSAQMSRLQEQCPTS